MVNKSMKLQETVIETKFKDIRSQNDLDRKNVGEMIRSQVRNIKAGGDIDGIGSGLNQLDDLRKQIAM